MKFRSEQTLGMIPSSLYGQRQAVAKCAEKCGSVGSLLISGKIEHLIISHIFLESTSARDRIDLTCARCPFMGYGVKPHYV